VPGGKWTRFLPGFFMQLLDVVDFLVCDCTKKSRLLLYVGDFSGFYDEFIC
jgi:hypothetical protein